MTQTLSDYALAQKYFKNTYVCPKCGSSSFNCDHVCVVGEEVLQDIKCQSCGLHWTDLYTLNKVSFDDGDSYFVKESTDERERQHTPIIITTLKRITTARETSERS